MTAPLMQLMLVTYYEGKMLLRSWPFRLVALLCLGSVLGATAGKLSLAYLASSEAFLGPMFSSTNATLRGLALIASLLTWTVMFFANDIGSRDRRIGIDDVVGSRMLTEGVYVIGRILGLLIPLSALMAITLAFMLWINFALGIRTATLSQFVPFFLFYNVLSVAFVVTLTTFFSAIIKHRFMSSLASLVCILIAGVWLVNVSEVFDIVGFRISGTYSELLGIGPIAPLVAHRSMYFLLTLCLIAATVFFYPRPEASRKSLWNTVSLVVLTFASVVFVGTLLMTNERTKARYIAWADALQEVSSQRAAGVGHYEMEVHLLPHEGAMSASTTLTLINRSETPEDTFIFVLNPSLKIDALTVKDDSSARFVRNGPIVELTTGAPLAPGETVESIWKYAGQIDPHAAWLQQPLVSEEASNFGQRVERALQNILTRNLERYMGKLSGWVGKRYCFLLPESNWYPIPNATFGHTYPDKRPKNFATATIRIHMPEGWTGVTQGQLAEQVQSDEGTVLAYEVSTPVSQFSLNVGEYVRVSTMVDDIELSLFYAPTHEDNIDFFSDATEELALIVSDSFSTIEDSLGLSYPYKTLSLVEAPSVSRPFSDTWDGRNLQVQPGVLLVGETGFFATSFAESFKRSRKLTQSEGAGTTDAQIKAELLRRYFEGNMHGRDLEMNLMPIYWEFQVDATGDSYLALTSAFTASLAETVLERHQRHYAYTLRMGILPGIHIGFEEGRLDSPDIGVDVEDRKLDRRILAKSMNAMTPGGQEETFVRLMNIKSHGLMQTLSMAMGKERWATFVPALLQKYRYDTLSMADFEREASSHAGQDLTWVFRQFLTEDVMPGYSIAYAEAYEIDNDERERLFQTVVRIDNLEEGQGFVNLVIELESSTELKTVERKIHFASHESKELRMVLSEKPTSVRLASPFARNSQDPIEMLNISSDARSESGVNTLHTVDSGPTELAVIVDDVDAGFALLSRKKYEAARSRNEKYVTTDSDRHRTRPEQKEILESGTNSIATNRWREQSANGAYGKYERTRMIRHGGDGTELAVWSAPLPQAGTYEVFMHISYYASSPLRGSYHITVEDAVATHEVEVELPKARDGWNSLGTYRFEPDTHAEVILSNKRGNESTSKRLRVHADAVKWVYQDVTN